MIRVIVNICSMENNWPDNLIKSGCLHRVIRRLVFDTEGTNLIVKRMANLMCLISIGLYEIREKKLSNSLRIPLQKGTNLELSIHLANEQQTQTFVVIIRQMYIC